MRKNRVSKSLLIGFMVFFMSNSSEAGKNEKLRDYDEPSSSAQSQVVASDWEADLEINEDWIRLHDDLERVNQVRRRLEDELTEKYPEEDNSIEQELGRLQEEKNSISWQLWSMLKNAMLSNSGNSQN